MDGMKGIDLWDDGTTAIVEGTDSDFAKALEAGILDERRVVSLDGKVTRVPPGIQRLRHIEELTLASGGIREVDVAIFALSRLQTWNIDSKRIETLPSGGWGRLEALETLEISAATGLTALPEDIGNAPRLGGRFELRGLTKLRTLPASFANLGHVTELLLGPKFEALPASLAGLSSLRELHIGETRIASLPSDVGSLTSLMQLHAWGARLASVPDSLGTLPNLETLNLGQNRLECIPAALAGLRQLRELDLSDNPIDAMPETLATLPLEVLRLHGTNVRRLPSALTAMTRLRRIALPLAHEAEIRASSPRVLEALGARVSFA